MNRSEIQIEKAGKALYNAQKSFRASKGIETKETVIKAATHYRDRLEAAGLPVPSHVTKWTKVSA